MLLALTALLLAACGRHEAPPAQEPLPDAPRAPQIDRDMDAAALAEPAAAPDARAVRAQSILTNMLENNGGDVQPVLDAPRRFTIRGRVITEHARQPVQDVELRWTASPDRATTDVSGAFVMSVPHSDSAWRSLQIAHPGFAEMSHRIDTDYNGEELLLVLRDSAHVVCTLTYEDGTPASDVQVHLFPARARFPAAQSVFSAGRDSLPFDRVDAYQYSSQASSDAQGILVISNVAAPEAYCAHVFGGAGVLVQPMRDAVAVQTTPGGVHTCRLILRRSARLLVKVLDADGIPARVFRIATAWHVPAGASASEPINARTDADGWCDISHGIGQTLPLSVNLRARLPEGFVAATNDLQITAPHEYRVMLYAVQSAARGVCGYLYDHTNDPLPGMTVECAAITPGHAWLRESATTDHTGFFVFDEPEITTAVAVRLITHVYMSRLETNLTATTEPVVWTLPRPNVLRGRVCIEHTNAPATQFSAAFMLGERQLFDTPDGRFEMMEVSTATSGVLTVWAGQYAPATRPFVYDEHGVCDAGDIIVAPSSCTLRGRVVSERGEPLAAAVMLNHSAGLALIPQATSRPDDGGYAFVQLPTGTYKVSAHKRGARVVASAPIELAFNQTYDVPDLVINMSSAVFVRIEFVMPDGTPAAHMRVQGVQGVTDAAGVVEDYFTPGMYGQVALSAMAQSYSAQPFEIAAHTRSLRVQLIDNATMQGTATLDGAPYSGSIELAGAHGRRDGCRAREGAFTFTAAPGRYLAMIRSPRAWCVAELAAGSGNILAFTSGDAALTCTLPRAGNWMAFLTVEHAGMRAELAREPGTNTDTIVFSGLPGGAYIVRCIERGSAPPATLEARVTLSPRQRLEVQF